MPFEKPTTSIHENDAVRAERSVGLEQAAASESNALGRFFEKKHLGRIAAAFALMTALAAGEARSAHGADGFFKDPNPSLGVSSGESFAAGVSAMPEKNRTTPHDGVVVTTEQLKNPLAKKKDADRENAPVQGDNVSTRSIGEIR